MVGLKGEGGEGETGGLGDGETWRLGELERGRLGDGETWGDLWSQEQCPTLPGLVIVSKKREKWLWMPLRYT